MNDLIPQFLWSFFIYSFLGWCLEISYAAVKKRSFFNKGVLNGPLCPVYGIGMIFCSIFFDSLHDSLFFLFVACTAAILLLEYFTGLIIERLYHKRWLDYSDYRFNLNGYVSVPLSALWGAGTAILLKYIHPHLIFLLGKIPSFPGNLILGILLFLLTADTLSILGFIFKNKRYHQRMEEMAESMQQLSHHLGSRIYRRIERRIERSFVNPGKPVKELTKTDTGAVFARGCTFHKLVWLFFIAALLGDITETIFCYATSGILMSRSSVVYGPFSIVWGLGVVVLTLMLHPYQNREDRHIFLFGVIMGGVYEYACSVFTELVFGTVFWDYSRIPFNLGGRINLLFCFFWGLAAVVWIKLLYPKLSGMIERVPVKTGHIISWCIVFFMVFDISVSTLSLGRYVGRQQGMTADSRVESFLDEHFPDERMAAIYPNAIIR